MKYLMGKKYKNHDLFDIPGNESTISRVIRYIEFRLSTSN